MGTEQLPPPARAIASAVTEAVSAAGARDRAGFESAVGRLAALNPAQVGVVLGAVARSLLEDLHPDGLSGADVQAVLERCARTAVGWFPDVDPTVLLGLVAGALGLHQSDEEEFPPPGGPAVAVHAVLLVTELLADSGRRLDQYLAAAFAELARAETVEMP